MTADDAIVVVPTARSGSAAVAGPLLTGATDSRSKKWS
jgi:hypothetical protein